MDDNTDQKEPDDQTSMGVSDFIAPENVKIIVAIISASVGITTATIKAFSLWIAEKQSRKVKLEYKDTKLEVNGGMPFEQIKELLELYANLHKEKIKEEEVKLTIKEDKIELTVNEEPQNILP